MTAIDYAAFTSRVLRGGACCPMHRERIDQLVHDSLIERTRLQDGRERQAEMLARGEGGEWRLTPRGFLLAEVFHALFMLADIERRLTWMRLTSAACDGGGS